MSCSYKSYYYNIQLGKVQILKQRVGAHLVRFPESIKNVDLAQSNNLAIELNLAYFLYLYFFNISHLNKLCI